MNRVQVASSNIKSIGYDELSSTLEVEFHNGSLRRYVGVPKMVYISFLNAPSKGKYFHSVIKKYQSV